MGPEDKNLPGPYKRLEPRTEKPFRTQRLQEMNFSTAQLLLLSPLSGQNGKLQLLSPHGEFLNVDSQKRISDGPNLGQESKHFFSKLCPEV